MLIICLLACTFAASRYGYTFDLSSVSSSITVRYYRTDEASKGKQIAQHEVISLEGDSEFSIYVYATIEGKCTEGYIRQFTAQRSTSGEYPKFTVTDQSFSKCPSGEKDPLQPGGDDTTTRYGYTFDLSSVSSSIIVKYYKTDEPNKRLQTAKHERITLEGESPFTIYVYATIIGKCTDGFIAQFEASKNTGSGYNHFQVNDNHFDTCNSGDEDKPTYTLRTFDVMFSLQQEKVETCNEKKRTSKL